MIRDGDRISKPSTGNGRLIPKNGYRARTIAHLCPIPIFKFQSLFVDEQPGECFPAERLVHEMVIDAHGQVLLDRGNRIQVV